MQTIVIDFAGDVSNPSQVLADILRESGVKGTEIEVGQGLAYVQIDDYDDAEVEEAWTQAMENDDRVTGWDVA